MPASWTRFVVVGGLVLGAAEAQAQFGGVRHVVSAGGGLLGALGHRPALSFNASVSWMTRYVGVTITPLDVNIRARTDADAHWITDWNGDTVCRDRSGYQTSEIGCISEVSAAVSVEALAIIPLQRHDKIWFGYGHRALSIEGPYVVGGFMVGPLERSFQLRTRVGHDFAEVAVGLAVGFPTLDEIRRARRGDRRGRPPIPPPPR